MSDEKYQSFTDNFKFTVTFYHMWEGKEGVTRIGTLIRDDWVLAASHLANVLIEGGKVVEYGEVLKIKEIIKHPKW